MTHTHTPGPWHVFVDEHVACELHIRAETLPYVATVFDSEIDHITARQLANARLIAAAPLMFEALRELCNDKYLSDPINTDRMKNARAAIAAATGAQT